MYSLVVSNLIGPSPNNLGQRPSLVKIMLSFYLSLGIIKFRLRNQTRGMNDNMTSEIIKTFCAAVTVLRLTNFNILNFC